VKADIDLARQKLATVPGFADDAAGAAITRLAGMTNLVFKVETPRGRFLMHMASYVFFSVSVLLFVVRGLWVNP